MTDIKVTLETSNDGMVWGSIDFGEDLITSCAINEWQLQHNLKDQLVSFYGMVREDIQLIMA